MDEVKDGNALPADETAPSPEVVKLDLSDPKNIPTAVADLAQRLQVMEVAFLQMNSRLMNIEKHLHMPVAGKYPKRLIGG